ncbi:MAG: hypothetical protein EBY25_04760 [Betaproteobacteria bacterium]|nr:hypothetical protein [Betaproteobacteria bacterium]
MPPCASTVGIGSMASGAEAACLALAVSKGWMAASDERRRLRRELVERIGAARIVDTASLFRHAISINYVSVAEADGSEAVQEIRRFVMPFASFADLA